MATINYQCSVCSRSIDILEKPYSLNVLSKCIITNGCKGKLNRISRNPNSNRESIPPPIAGLPDYIQRKVFYDFTQNFPSTTWNINHNLGSVPAVDVYINNNGNSVKLDIIDYKIKIVDKNNITLVFPIQYSGVAQLVARTSVQSYNSVPISTSNNIQISFGASFVFAVPRYITDFSPTIDTLNNNNTIQLLVSVTEPNQEEIICVEPLPQITDNTTPWVGWHEILLRKRKDYVIFYKNIFSFTNTFSQQLILPTDIPDGTQIRFLEISFGNTDNNGNYIFLPIEQDKLIVLLGNPPYDSIDKIRNQVIDVGSMIKNDVDYFYYNDGEIYTSDENIQSTYPNIELVS